MPAARLGEIPAWSFIPRATSIARARRSGPEPRKLVLVPGGDHHSVQHHPELRAVALRWLMRYLAL